MKSLSSFFCHHTNNNWKLKIFTFCAIYALSSFGALPFYQNEKMKILINYISFSKVATEFTTVALKVTRLCHCVKTATLSYLRLLGIYLILFFFFSNLNFMLLALLAFRLFFLAGGEGRGFSVSEKFAITACKDADGGKAVPCGTWILPCGSRSEGRVAGSESFHSKNFLVM